ncbi:MAG: phosphopantetheine adenylyltransferase [Myxococcaceae bacterium]|nr:phosphopantetheine adenylyltransferase [Myxococcaceae bacterium]
MMTRSLLLLVAVLNLVPGVVALVPSRAEALYGVSVDGPALGLTMRHRAVLLAMLGGFLALAAFDEAWWRPALMLALTSKLSFLVLFVVTGPHEAPLRRVAMADLGALAALAVVAALRSR